MNKNDLLTIGYSTLADRASDIKFLKDVKNLVVVQNPEKISLPDFAPDVRVFELNNRGVTKSRNTVLANTDTKYLLFGDDDISFSSAGIEAALTFLEQNLDISILLLRAVDESGKLRKQYPQSAHSLRLTNSAKAATYELIIRVADIKAAGITFDENFGAGAKNYLGDEYIFIADAIRAGLKGKFLPITIAVHPAESSGSIKNTREDIRARSKIFGRVFGVWAPIMRALFILKPPTKKFGFNRSLLFIIGK